MSEMKFNNFVIIWDYYFLKILRICLSASFTQYAVTITQIQKSVSAFNPGVGVGGFLRTGVGDGVPNFKGNVNHTNTA